MGRSGWGAYCVCAEAAGVHTQYTPQPYQKNAQASACAEYALKLLGRVLSTYAPKPP